MKGSAFIFDYVHLLYYKCRKINLNRGGLSIDFPDWIKKTKAIIYLVNDDGKCFQYDTTVALSYDKNRKDPERITKIKFFINKFNWKGIDYPSGNNDWKMFEKNNPTIALNMLYFKIMNM